VKAPWLVDDWLHWLQSGAHMSRDVGSDPMCTKAVHRALVVEVIGLGHVSLSESILESVTFVDPRPLPSSHLLTGEA
jgi:hypothetical protein